MSSRAIVRAVILVALAIAATLVFRLRPPPAPCTKPIKYSLGDIDARFNVSAPAVLDAAREATSIWSRAEGRSLFSYDPNAPLRLNFVYDARQATTSLGTSLSSQESSQGAARDALEAREQTLTTSQLAYNFDVQSANARGGATADEARALQIRRAELDAATDSLRRDIDAFNARGTAINSAVDRFNQHAGQVLTAGRYVRDSSGRRIDIFKFVDETELTRFLAHEFGHALGLDHNGDSTSIMYGVSESGSLVASNADLASLRALCGR